MEVNVVVRLHRQGLHTAYPPESFTEYSCKRTLPHVLYRVYFKRVPIHELMARLD